jgi:hypothetical protein
MRDCQLYPLQFKSLVHDATCFFLLESLFLRKEYPFTVILILVVFISGTQIVHLKMICPAGLFWLLVNWKKKSVWTEIRLYKRNKQKNPSYSWNGSIWEREVVLQFELMTLFLLGSVLPLEPHNQHFLLYFFSDRVSLFIPRPSWSVVLQFMFHS